MGVERSRAPMAEEEIAMNTLTRQRIGQTAGSAADGLPTATLAEGLVMGESPRWHGNRLWVSDMFGREVVAVDLTARAESPSLPRAAC